MAELTTAFTQLVGCRAPIQLATMGGGPGTPELAAAVSAAGGLGMLSASYPLGLADQLASVRERTTSPVGVGFFAFDLPARQADLEVAAELASVVDFFWGPPDPQVVDVIHAGGALSFWQVGSVEEAREAADAGCDVVVAQGVEAGGHVRGTTPLRDLLDEVVEALDIPIVAAGGIATGRALADVLNAGAAGARVGTRFLASDESGAHRDYIAALLHAGGGDTERTTAFAGGWPDAPHRVLRTSIEAARAATSDVVGQADFGAMMDVERWSALPPSVLCTGDVRAMAMYAGAGVGDVTEVLPAADIVERLVAEALPLVRPDRRRA